MTGLTSDAVTPPDGEDDSTATKDRALALIRALKEKVAAAQRTTDTDEQSKRPDTMHTYHVSFQGRRGNEVWQCRAVSPDDALRRFALAERGSAIVVGDVTQTDDDDEPCNAFGLACPLCNRTDCVEIEVRAWVRLNGESADPYASQRFSGWQWAGDDPTACANCGHTATVKDFRPTE